MNNESRGGDKGNVSQPSAPRDCGRCGASGIYYRCTCGWVIGDPERYSQTQVDDMIQCAQREATRVERERIWQWLRNDGSTMMAKTFIGISDGAPAVPATPPATAEQEKGSTLKGWVEKKPVDRFGKA